ncbi:ubiquitin C-terminal hydrolase 13-like isoform X2 [Vicia villosa]|uniref:ubiquitin C-terminal hydrolase 13-like isoform X2 n=1 Tax=Vicia villosa TaxID=3911 RepID=UPI00273AB750|nr:ubiquitin C-terminal hydrolase 13-like isoform X2 [Vicia villosa]
MFLYFRKQIINIHYYRKREGLFIVLSIPISHAYTYTRVFPILENRLNSFSAACEQEEGWMAGGSIVENTTTPFRFTWRIDGFSQLTEKRLYSDVFEVGGYKWRVLIFPKGNNVDCLSIYLDAADSSGLPDGWTRFARFCLGVVSQVHTKYSRRKDSYHQFNKHRSDWGFTSFMPLNEFYDPSRGYLVNDTLVIEVDVICDANENDTAEHLRERLKEEQEDLCTIIEKSSQDLSDGFVQERLKKEQEELCTFIEKSAPHLSSGFVLEMLKKEQEDLFTFIEKSPQNLPDGFVQERLKEEQEGLCTIIEKSAQDIFDEVVQESLKEEQEDLCPIIEKSAQNLSDGFVQERLKEEQEDPWTIIKVVRDEDLAEQIGNDIYFDLVDTDKVKSFRVPKDTSFNIFKEEVAKELGIPAQFQRFWLWEKRESKAYRPFRPLTQIEEAGPVGQLRELKEVKEAELNLFLEVERGLDLRPIAPLEMRDDDILLFFKLYDPEIEELRYAGRLFVNPCDKLSEILTRLNILAGYDPNEEIELYEEIRCEPVDKNLTFLENWLGNGDIICFQKASAMDKGKHIRNPDVLSYLQYVYNLELSFSLSAKESECEESLEKQNKNVIAEEINAMIDENVIAAIDRVLSEGITISVQSQHPVQQKVSLSLPEQLLQELSDILFKEDLVEKFKKGLTHEVDFNLVMEKIAAYADLFSSHQLEQVGAVKNLLNNLVRIFEKMEYLKIKQDSAKKSTDKHNEALKKTREKIMTSQTSFTNHQTYLNSLDGEIADLKAKLEKLQVDRDNIAEIQDQEKDKITCLNKEVKSIFHLLVDDHIKVKAVEDKIPAAQADLENYEKLYQYMKAAPPF